MGTTDHGFTYPSAGALVQNVTDFTALANSIEAGFDAYETWNSWTPTWNTGGGYGGFASVGGSGFNEGFYVQRGKFVHAEFRIELASGFSVTAGFFRLALPVTAFTWGATGSIATVGSWLLRDNSGPFHFTGSLATVFSFGANVWFAGSWWNDPAPDAPSGVVDEDDPITWATGDVISGVLNYRAA